MDLGGIANSATGDLGEVSALLVRGDGSIMTDAVTNSSRLLLFAESLQPSEIQSTMLAKCQPNIPKACWMLSFDLLKLRSTEQSSISE